MTDITMLLAGLVLLAVGGELLVRGAVAIAERLGMSPLLIGLTLVGFGTSVPELMTSVLAAMAGSPGIAVGNIVGSNISNLLLVLGLSALITPIAVNSTALKRDGAIVLATALLMVGVGYLTNLDQLVGAVFVTMLAAYIIFAYRQEMLGAKEGHSAAFEVAQAYDELHDGPIRYPSEVKSWAERLGPTIPFIMAISGLLIVVFGGKLLVDGAIGLAKGAGISETVIGLTVVAIGTSMPEFITSLIAALRKHSDVALGNILGSSIYNILGIGGVTGLISPTSIPDRIVHFDSLVMAGASLAMLIFAQSGLRIGRLEGLALLTGYIVYIYLLWPK